MNWTAIWSDNAKKELKRLSFNIQKRILNKTNDVEGNLFQYLERLTGRSFYKYRVGNYRIIIDVVNNKLVLHLLKMKKRSRVYK